MEPVGVQPPRRDPERGFDLERGGAPGEAEELVEAEVGAVVFVIVEGGKASSRGHFFGTGEREEDGNGSEEEGKVRKESRSLSKNHCSARRVIHLFLFLSPSRLSLLFVIRSHSCNGQPLGRCRGRTAQGKIAREIERKGEKRW